MADLLTSAVVGSVVDKLLTQVLQAVSLALQHNKNCEALHSLLTRLQPLVSEICGNASAGGGGVGSAVIENWLQSLSRELKKAEEILQSINQSSISVTIIYKKISTSKKILSVTQSIRDLLQEVGLLGLLSTQSVHNALQENFQKLDRDYFEWVNSQLLSLQHHVHRLELAQTTRNALGTPTTNYGSSVGTTTVDRAFSEIKESADSFVWSGGNCSSDARQATPAAAAAPKFRRQDSENVFGGGDVVEDVQKLLLLSQNEGGRRWVGVWATGGAGKTLTAQRVYNSPAVQSHFTGGAFWITVGRASSVKMLLRALFIELLDRPVPEVMLRLNDLDAKDKLCRELRGLEKVVLFLDDVWDPTLLDWLDVLPAGMASGNKIFVTTRNVEVLERKHAEKMQIPMLSEEDSWKLFCWHAFHGAPNVLRDHHLEEVARKVTDECKGLPLALKVIGAAFAGKRELWYWQRSLEKLKNAEILSQEHEKQLFMRLELSLEELPDVHPRLKDCFLYFAAFPEDSEVRVVGDLLDVWIGERIVGSKQYSYDSPEDEAYELLGWLIARSLIELHSPHTRTFQSQTFMACKIHDILRDLARYKLQHNKEPHTRECLYEAGRQLTCFPPEWMTSNGQISMSTLSPQKLLARRLSLIFNSLEELPQQLNAPDLQVLLLRDNPLAKLPRGLIDCFRNLRVLDLRNTKISELPSTLGKLKLLVVLNLRSCAQLENIPDSIGELKELRRLNLANCKRLSSLPSKLFRLTSLQNLNMSSSVNVWNEKGSFSNLLSRRAALKDVSCLTELTQLYIASSTLKKFSITLNSLNKLRSLEVRFPQVVYLPDVGDLKALELLSLEGCRSLRSLPSSLASLTNLITVQLSSCEALSTLPALDLLPQLEKLDLSNCSGLVELPSSFARAGAFPALRELPMYGCTKVATFPALEAGAMPQVALLNLSGWTQLISLPQSLQQLKDLRTLEVSLCWNLRSLDESLDLLSLSSLEELDVGSNPSLSSLPAALASLPNFKVLKLQNSRASIPNELLQMETQERLKILRQNV